MLGAIVCLAAGCTQSERTSSTASTTVASTGANAPTAAPTAEGPGFATLPPVDQFAYPTGPDDIVAQISVDAPAGPDVPLLTVYGDGTVIAATNDGWRIGRVSDLAVQDLLADAESVGLLDEPLNLHGPGPPPEGGSASTSTSTSTSDSPDITIRLDVDGRTLLHELDLSRIERPPGIRVFLNAATVQNRFDLTTPFDPTSWVSCSAEQCEIVASQQDPTSRPVLPHEDAADLLAP